MKQLLEEILTEIPKLEDYNYSGLVVVHPEDVEEILKFIHNNINNSPDEVVVNSKYKHIKLQGCIRICTTEAENWQFNHAGMQYTTILISLEAFGRHTHDSDGKYIDYKPVGIKSEHGFAYMITRLRSKSKFLPRMVIC